MLSYTVHYAMVMQFYPWSYHGDTIVRPHVQTTPQGAWPPSDVQLFVAHVGLAACKATVRCGGADGAMVGDGGDEVVNVVVD